jgi:nucleoside-diphosphate-sugar epimerase
LYTQPLANILQPEELQKVFIESRPDVVIHAVGVYPLGAARYSMKGQEAVFQVNVEGTRNVVAASKECGARALCYTSSVTVVLDELDEEFRNVNESWLTGRATTSYGISKASMNSFVNIFSLRVGPPFYGLPCLEQPCKLYSRSYELLYGKNLCLLLLHPPLYPESTAPDTP